MYIVQCVCQYYNYVAFVYQPCEFSLLYYAANPNRCLKKDSRNEWSYMRVDRIFHTDI